MDDKTRIALKPRMPGASLAEDRTRIAKPTGDDRTRIQPRPNIQSAGHEAPARREVDDATRVKMPKRGAATPDEKRLQVAVDLESNDQILKGRFVFEEVLGAGGMGVVYKAKDLLKVEAQDREPYVAIKVLSEEFKAHPEAFIALQRESRKTQRMAHPNIVNVHDFDRDGDTVFMTMEYMEGTPLDRLISQYRSIGLPRDMVWRILEDICAALIYAHEQNVIHSDFKPGNIFVTHSGTAKVFDFGIARAVAKAENLEDSVDDKTVFDAGNLGALTPAYASLEMLQGEAPDIRDDIYALGCIAYELFTGEHPFNRVHADEAKRQNKKPKRIAGLSKKQWRTIEHALAFRRSDRIESVEEFWRNLTEKKRHSGRLAIGGLFVSVLTVTGYFLFAPEPPPALSEDEFRSEIERNLRIEMKMDAVKLLFESPDFTPAWEAELWSDIQELRRLKGTDDDWLGEMEAKLFQLYLSTAADRAETDRIQEAEALLVNAGRYGEDSEAIDAVRSKIAEAKAARERELAAKREREQRQAEERRREAERAQALARQNSEFDQALANLRRQLQCHSNINMSDFSIALGKLKSISAQRYAAEEAAIVNSLSRCIESIGRAFPERAEEAKRQAMTLFSRNGSIAAISIRPRDPCDIAMAGHGAQTRGGTCRDRIPSVQTPPVMVVIPAGANISPFAIGQTEVTIEQINEFCRATKSCEPVNASDSQLPANNIPIAVANDYLKWLSAQSGYRYRLPSRVEWQHAANAADSRLDPNRNCRLNSRGISKGNALVRVSVGQKNKWGLMNHFGNAQEWVTDRGGKLLAIGGSFETPMEQCRSDYSVPHKGAPDSTTGFRVLRELSSQP